MKNIDSYKINKSLNKIKSENIRLWIAEANFAFSHLYKFVSSFPSNSNILEVGCGSGILLSILSEEFPHHRFTGIEPFGDGFSGLKELNKIVKKSDVNLINDRYENHNSNYDFIFCINVFEHVDDWKHFLSWASNNLKKNGIFFVLCPNYGFPYESHFKLPIFINKKLTYKFFKRSILKHEKNNNCHGLWNSLNFVKKKEVIDFCKNNFAAIGLHIDDDISIIDNMIERVAKDVEFKKRQKIIGGLASLVDKIGFLNFLKKFPNFLPYMKLTFKKN